MQNRLIVVDPGHGQGNRTPGVFDPGAVRYHESQVQGPLRSNRIPVGPPGNSPSGSERGPKSKVEATEAELALRYAVALEEALRARGFSTLLTRADHQTPCSLKHRLQTAQQNRAALLVSLHLNAAPESGAPNNLKAEGGRQKAARGHEVLYRTAGSAAFAGAVSKALAQHIPPHGVGLVRRAGLYLLQYDPSALVEVGFLDSDQDYALLADDLFKVAAMESVAGAIENKLNH